MTEAKESALKLNNLLKLFSGSFLIRISYTLFGFINSVLLARFLGAEQYGIYVFVLSVVALLSIPTQFGMPMLVVREFAAFQAKRQWSLMKGLGLRSHQFVFVVSLMVCCCSALLLLINPGNYSDEKQHALFIGLLLVPVLSMGALRDAMLRGLRHVILGQLPEGFIRPLLFMLGLMVAVFAMQLKAIVSGVLIYYVICSLAAFVVGWLLFARCRPSELITAPTSFNSKAWFLAAFPIGITSAMQVFSGELSILYLGFLSLDEDIAFFRIAVLASGFIVIFMQVADSIVAPYFSRLYQQQRYSEIESLIRKVCIITTALTLPFFLVFLFFGEWLIITFYGTSYKFAYLPLIILSIGQVINSALGPVALLLVMSGQQQLVTRITFLSLLINLLLHMVLIPFYGMIGAAIATSVSLVLWKVSLLWQVNRKLPIKYLL
jgi:O-antigen/teichoic acid export membrane protein